MAAEGERPTLAALVGEAEASSGLSDWGRYPFFPTVERLLESCRATADLTPAGWSFLRRVLVRHLRNQLSLQDYLSGRPGPALPGVAAPLVVTGLPRTGTTLLHNLLAADPANRVLRLWEALDPAYGRQAGGRDEARRRADAWLAGFYRLVPSFPTIHALTPDGPEECDALLQNTFASQHLDDTFRARAYSAWLAEADLVEEYAHFAVQLQVLAGQEPPGRHWVLKSPGHLAYLDTVVRTFPGVRVVVCHREPVEAVASYASLTLAVRRPHAGATPPAEVGRYVLDRCAGVVRRARAARRRHPPGGYLDVEYEKLVAEPLAVVEDIYGWLGRVVSDELRAAAGAWLAANPQHRHGRHDYDLARFGLSASDAVAALADG